MASSPSSRKPARPRKQTAARKRAELREQWRQGFEEWFDYMADGLKEFFRYLPSEVRDKLDYSVESLDILEAWLLERYPSLEVARAETNSLVFDGAARYIGETYCKVLGGHWYVDLVHDSFLGLPQVTGFDSGPGSLCPLTLATACTSRRRGNFISNNLRKQMVESPEHEQD